MASIRKRGDSWFAQVSKAGIRKSASFATKAKAQAWAVQVESEILAGKMHGNSEKRFIDALERYAAEVSTTKRGERWEIIRIEKFKRLPFAHFKLSDITTPILADWRDMQLKSLKASSVNREMNLLSAIFEQCRREWQWIDKNPVRDVRRPPQPKHRERIFTADEIVKIVKQLGLIDGFAIEYKQQIVALAFLFSLETAMRREEITGLEWDRVDLLRRFVTLIQTKNGDSRHVPLSNDAVKLLNIVRDKQRPFDISPDVLSTLFRRACNACGVQGATFHDSSATALTRLSKKLNVLELARMAGHRDLKSLQVYYRETAEEIAFKLD